MNAAPENTVKQARWFLTVNNYDRGINYKDYFTNCRYRVKRMVMGFDRGSETQTPHLRAYLEFVRSYRYSVVRTLLAAGSGGQQGVARKRTLLIAQKVKCCTNAFEIQCISNI